MTRVERGIAVFAVLLGVTVWFSLSRVTPRTVDPQPLEWPIQPVVPEAFASLPPVISKVTELPASATLPPTSYPATAAEQHAADASAQPGEWVTPPAYSKSE